MPFILRCPHCGKFMLLEDEVRGSTVRCLCCPGEIAVSAAPEQPGAKGALARGPSQVGAAVGQSDVGQTPAPSLPAPNISTPRPAPAPDPPPLTPPRESVQEVSCPGCQARLRVRALQPNQALRCPKCKEVFRP